MHGKWIWLALAAAATMGIGSLVVRRRQKRRAK